jgi:hypothetical protein
MHALSCTGNARQLVPSIVLEQPITCTVLVHLGKQSRCNKGSSKSNLLPLVCGMCLAQEALGVILVLFSA